MISIQQQIACVERELKMRRNNYPRWVNAGNLTQDLADKEIERMEAVLNTLKGLCPPERTLFDQE